MANKELNEDTSFKVSIKTLIAIAIALSTVIGMCFQCECGDTVNQSVDRRLL